MSQNPNPKLNPNPLEQRWQLAQQSADFGVWDLDLGREQVHYPPQWKARLGYEASEQPEATTVWRSRVHPDDLQPMFRSLMDHAEGRCAAYEREFRLRVAQGGYRWMLSRGRVVERDRHGRALRMVGMLTDITARREAERERAAQERAQAERRSKAEFLSRMSHDLRTPLNAVLGFSQLLRVQAGQIDAQEQRRYAAHIEEAGRQLLGMVNGMLELSSMETALLHRPVRLVELPLWPMLLDVVTALQPQALAAAVDVRLAPADAAASVDSSQAAVLADAQRLQQVFTQLLSNAIRFNRIGGSVQITLQAHPRGWTVAFRDTGVGIAEQDLPRLFEPFNRLASAAPAAAPGGVTGAGMGIGLTLSRWLLDCMGGQLSVRSVLGVGSTFEVLLPAHAGHGLGDPVAGGAPGG